MTPHELRAWSTAPAQRESPVAAAVRALFAHRDELARRAARLADLVPEVERLRADLEIAEAHNKTYAAENGRLRRQLSAQNPAPWET